jgi:hypothetical protein
MRIVIATFAVMTTATFVMAACPGDCPIPGQGAAMTECLAELDGATLNDPASNPRSIRCTDGDPACDADATANGACHFQLLPCLANVDPRFPECSTPDVTVYEVKNKPESSPKYDPEMGALQAAAADVLPATSPVCGDSQTITVPLKARKTSFGKGKKTIRILARNSAGLVDRDRLRLLCEPGGFGNPQAGFAEARVITNAGELIDGPLARGRLGDYLLFNDEIQVVILAPGRHAHNAVGMYGGNIYDADIQRTSGPERDNFEAIAPGINIEATANYTNVTILNDGTNGQPAVIRATGPDDLLDKINPSSTVAGFGFTFPPSADDTSLPVDIQTDYILAASVPYVRMETTLTNTSGSPVDFYFAEYTNGSGQVELFLPTYGIGEALATTSCSPSTYAACDAGTCDLCNYISWSGEDLADGVSYGLVHPVDGSTTFNTSGVSVAIYGLDAVLVLIGAAPENFHLAASGNPGDSLTLTRWFAVGKGSVGDIVDIRNQIQGVDTGTITGQVTSGGQPVVDADVAVTAPVVPGPLGSPMKNVVAHFRTDADGVYRGTLPPNTYTIQANKPGRLAASPASTTVALAVGATETADFTLPAPARIRVHVTDENDDPIAAKVQLVGFDPSPDPGNSQSIFGLINNNTGVYGQSSGGDGLPFGIAFSEYADRTGDTGELEMEPGTYQLVVSHGPRYSAFTQNVTLTAGQTSVLDAQIARVVDTPGFISGDWHVHSINSADSEVTNEERVATELAEGIDFFTPSDHELRVNFAPVIAAMGVGDLIGTAPSAEITTFDYGHFNSWPVTVDPGQLDGGSVDHGGAPPIPGTDFPGMGSYSLSPGEIIDEAHADPLANLVQINHMRSHFDRDGLAIDTGMVPPQSFTPGASRRLDPGILNYFDADFDALEVWIGTDGRNGALSEFLGDNAGDWFNLLNQGILRTGVTSSDTHQRRNSQIHARSYVASATSDPAALSADPETLAANVVAGRVIGTDGPFPTVTVDAASTGETAGHAIGLPTLIATTDGEVDVTVDVKSPLWAEFDRIELYVNHTPEPDDDDSNVATPNRYRVCADFAQNVVPTVVNDHPGIPGASHLEASHTFNLTGLTDDVWIVAMVRGTDGVSRPLFPVVPNSLNTAGNGTLAGLTDGNLGEGGMPALAYANPLYVDVDGGGWTPPGVAFGACP